MLFNSLEFLFFLPTVLVLYYLLPHKFRWALLLIASYYFYGSWKVEFLSLLVISTICDFFVARAIEKSNNSLNRKLFLAISLVVNLGLLVFFKYAHFLTQEFLAISSIPETEHENILSFVNFDLPVGISFYTFQTLGYTLDVYFNRVKAQQNIGKFGLYVSYFPQLVAGPIERYGHLSNQLFKEVKLKYENLSNGFRLVLYGFFIKMVIADNLAPLVDQIFETPEDFNYVTVAGGIFAFGWQIYADFYGYSLIAIGVAKAMGVNLMDNFKTPYFSTSIVQFWKRWHISLSTWFRDYLYVPLGGNRVSSAFWIRNILAVFLISGIWHGANWTFLIWGGIHALMYFAERFTPIKWTRTNLLQKILGLIITYLTVNMAWAFFRANSFNHAMQVFDQILQFDFQKDFIQVQLQLLIFFTLFLLLEIATRKIRIDEWLGSKHVVFRWVMYSLLLYLILGFAGITNHPFIYFQF